VLLVLVGVIATKEPKRCFKFDRNEIVQNCSSSEYPSADEISDMTSYFQDGGDDVISRKKLEAPPRVTSLYALRYMIHNTFVLVY